MKTRLAFTFIILAGGAACAESQPTLPAGDLALAERIAAALRPDSGEHAVLRYDADTTSSLPNALMSLLEKRGVTSELVPYGPVADFELTIARAGIYVWLPDNTENGTTADQAAALVEWLDAGRGRQIHFHWGAGTMNADGLVGQHSDVYEAIYREALEIDHTELNRAQDAAIAALRSGRVQVTTPAGTDLSFELGDRPVNKQNGDASPQAMAAARTRIDREIELPAGVIRVAPIETTVEGTLVVPEARFPDGIVRGLTLECEGGEVSAVSATEGEEFFHSAAEAAPALNHFRELGIGLNPRLQRPAGEQWIPYYGYGAAVIRLSLGNNQEVGGAVGGQGVRWFFFPDATVRVGETVIVQDGALAPPS